MERRYVRNPYAPTRRATREVLVGSVALGGTNPIRIQSMTNTDTLDTDATVAQVEAMAAAGCEIARITAPSTRDAENLAEIKAELLKRGVAIPLVADIHFTPNAAMIAVEHVEKIRVNPGNYADKKRFEVREYSDAQYAEELERVSERFRPLVLRCKELGRAMRIGTNHGSLSDRIMNRWGDSPRGMVESALEFLDVCEQEDYRDIVFSMKASNPVVMVHAYRLLAQRLTERAGTAPSYPFHLGVTEAGDGEDGRIKSAIGIGSLLEDGIGDTIRVSLTESPIAEIPVARLLARRYETRWEQSPEVLEDPGASDVDDATSYARRATRQYSFAGIDLGGESSVRVELDLGLLHEPVARAVETFAEELRASGDLSCEGIVLDATTPEALEGAMAFQRGLRESGIQLPLALRITPALVTKPLEDVARIIVAVLPESEAAALADLIRYAKEKRLALQWHLEGSVAQVRQLADRIADAQEESGVDSFLVSVTSSQPVLAMRVLIARLRARGFGEVPAILQYQALDSDCSEEDILRSAVDIGSLLGDGIGDGVLLAGFRQADKALSLAYRILQGSRRRVTRAEYISCPSCGRTLFDLEEVTARIKARTDHLKGVSIAIMGCIVNGPGEMADADFGYVGSGPGKVNLYVGQEVVARNVEQIEAEDRLVELIRERGRWVDP